MDNGDGARGTSSTGSGASDKLSIGPVQLPAGRAGDTVRAAGHATVRASRRAVRLGNTWLGRLRETAAQRRRPQPGHRPDGSLVAPSPPVSSRPSGNARGPLAAVTGPFEQAAAAVRGRWQDAVREGKLAAREKEAQIRAEYESRVSHSPRLHAEQHNLQERRRD